MLEKYLEDLESRIDPAVEEELLDEWKRFVDGRFGNGIFSPKRSAASPPAVEWPKVLINDAIGDFELMALRELAACSAVLERGDGRLMCVRSNYGSSILPSLFGAEMFFMEKKDNVLPTSRPLEGGPEAAGAALDRGVPPLEAGLGGKVMEMGRRFVELFEGYPGIAQYVRIYHPDTQGPMDVCEVLWGSRLFLDIVDRPDLVKGLLEVITETYIAFMNEWNAVVPPAPDYSVHWSYLHRGTIMLRDDSAMNFSPGMFEEFIEPYDQRLLDEFGGGAIHFCGRGDHYIHRVGRMRGVNAVAMSQPEYNDMETIFRNTVDRGIALCGGGVREAAEKALAQGRDLHGMVAGL